MSFEEDLAAELPRPRDDEPESLRRDVLDELADHLACSYRRELLSGADAESARRRAFERFGNPAAVARRLWFDAMKGRIMSQRILVTACVLLAVSCVALVGVSWFQWDRMSRAQSQQIAASQAMQDVMLKQLQTLTKAVEHPRSPDWNPASFKLTEETLDGPPAVGVNVSFGKEGVNQTMINRVSGAQGIVDLEALQPGGYSFSIHRKANEKFYSTWATSGTVQVKPYQELFKSIICPRADLQHVPIRLECKRPADVKGRGLVLHVGFRGLSRKLPDGTTWGFLGLEEGQEPPPTPHPGMGGGMGGGFEQPVPRLNFLIDLDGGKIERIRGVEPYYGSDGSIPMNYVRSSGAPASELLGHAHAFFRRSDRTPISGDFNVLEGDHSLALLAILRPSRQIGSEAVDGYDVVALETSGGGMGIFGGGMGTSYQQRPDWMPKPSNNPREVPLPFYTAAIRNSPPTLNPAATWSAVKDRVNTWTIKVPGELIAAARDALNADIEKTLATDTSASWIERLNAAGVAAGPIYKMDEVFADKQVQHLGVATDMETPDRGTLKVIRQPFTMSRTPSTVAMPTPERGEHTDEVLTEFGFSTDEIEELKKVGAT